MSPQFYLYLIAATVALLWVVYHLLNIYSDVNLNTAVLFFIPVLLLYYLAYKVYQIKNDNELM